MNGEIIQTEEAEEKKYPYIGKTENGDVVLFIGPKRGIALVCGRNYYFGEFSSDWVEEIFIRMDEITIKFK